MIRNAVVLLMMTAWLLGSSACFPQEQPAPYLMTSPQYIPFPHPDWVGSIVKHGDPDESRANRHSGDGSVSNAFPQPSLAVAKLFGGWGETRCNEEGGVDVLDGYSYTKYDVILDPEWEDPPVPEEWLTFSYWIVGELYGQNAHASAELSDCMWRILWTVPGAPEPSEAIAPFPPWVLTGPGRMWINEQDEGGDVKIGLQPGTEVEMEVIAGYMAAETSEQAVAYARLYWFQLTTEIEHGE